MGIKIVPNSSLPGQGEKMSRGKAPGMLAGAGIFKVEMQGDVENRFCFKPRAQGIPNPSASR